MMPVDYQFLEINERFAELTGLDGQMVVGRRVTEVIPGITKDLFNWIEFYGNVALNNCEESFEQYSQVLGRWYKVHAYSPAPNDFVTFFFDISEKKIDCLVFNDQDFTCHASPCLFCRKIDKSALSGP
jgi:PAS domain-containing protein